METRPLSVVFVGPPGVGKTSLIHRLTQLGRPIAPTAGPEAYALSREAQTILVWDTPGQDRFGSFSDRLLANASLVVSCSDTGAYTRPHAVCATGHLDGHVLPAGEASSPVGWLRVRTKDDLQLGWFPADLATSAKTGAGVRELYDALFALTQSAMRATERAEAQPPVVGGGCCCFGSNSEIAHKLCDINGVKVTHTQLDEWRLELMYHEPRQ